MKTSMVISHIELFHIVIGFTKSATSSRSCIELNTQVFHGFAIRIFGVRCSKHNFAFSRMRSKGSRFTLGVWGLRVRSLDVASASATVRNRPQPSAAVRNRSYELRMAVPMGSSAEVVIFGGFRRVVASFRVAGVALRDIQTCSATCRKSFCVAGAILL